ncbi:MAG TPA: glycosyltransferase family 4 protein [Gaiellaceae bacterium]
MSRRRRILVLNQYYWPGVEATAHLLTELCECLAEEFVVTVVTASRGDEAPAGRSARNGVEIVRVRATGYDRTKLLLRATNYASYLASSLVHVLTEERPDLILCMTDPPVIGDVGYAAARRFRVPLAVISQDVFPEIAIELGRLENPLVVKTLRTLINFYLRKADAVVAIGERMRERLVEKGARAERVVVIPNWVRTEAIQPMPQDNDWARDNDLAGRFVVMHSGNIGHAQDLDSLVRAATFLRDLDDVTIALIGAGARLADLSALAERLETENVTFLPYQPRPALSQSLSTGSVHVVGLAKGLSGFVVPSRLYGVMAAGRPVIVSADDDSETAQVVLTAGAGIVVPPGSPDRLAAAIRAFRAGKYDIDEMGRRAREYVLEESDRVKAVDAYSRLLRELADGRETPSI